MPGAALTWPTDSLPLLRAAWALILSLALEAGGVALVVLWSPARAVHVTSGQADAWDDGSANVSLTLRDGRWVGPVDAFPVGSTTHFVPKEHPGFYLVRFSDGTFLAMADRSSHRGKPVEWMDPRLFPRGPAGGRPKESPETTWVFNDGDSIFLADGFTAGGPNPRPLDPFPVAVEGGLIYVEPYALCPAGAVNLRARGGHMRWCDSRVGRPEPPERCSKIVPTYCWSPSGGPFGHHYYTDR